MLAIIVGPAQITRATAVHNNSCDTVPDDDGGCIHHRYDAQEGKICAGADRHWFRHHQDLGEPGLVNNCHSW